MQEELKELIKLNKKEALIVIKDYLSLYFYSFIKDKDNTRRNILLEKLKEYLAIIKEENKYYKFLIENIHKIKDEATITFRQIDFLYKNDKAYALVIDAENTKGATKNIVISGNWYDKGIYNGFKLGVNVSSSLTDASSYHVKYSTSTSYKTFYIDESGLATEDNNPKGEQVTIA